jgi:uncharacterized membrane protein YjfL (UPF0719 family)
MHEPFSVVLFHLGRSCLWAFVSAIVFAISLVVALKIFDLFTPELQEFKEISRDNRSAAAVICCLILAIAFLVAHVI